MVGGRASTIIFYAAVVFCAVVFGLYWLEMFVGWDGWCPPEESAAKCSREWFGASAGWIAAVAAGCTIIVLLNQVRETRRHTEFAVGDADPAAHVVLPQDAHTMAAIYDNRIRIVNWNRSPCRLEGITMASNGDLEITRLDFPGQVNDDGFVEREIAAGRVTIPGWEDRSRAPHTAEFDVAVMDGGKETDEPARRELWFDVDLRVMDRSHRAIRLRVGTPDGIYY